VRFRYEANGRLTVNVRVEGAAHELEHEIARENSLTQEQLDNWRKYVCGVGSEGTESEPEQAEDDLIPQGMDIDPFNHDSSPGETIEDWEVEILSSEEVKPAQSDVDPRIDFIRTRYAEERNRLRGTSNDPARSDEMAFQFVMREFSLSRQELKGILGEA
jgi:hypothetical protein